MKEKSLEWRTRDGILLMGRIFRTSARPRAVIGFVHGLGEHCGRYSHLARYLTKRHYHLALFDMRGHGLSGGKRVHTPSYSHLFDDMDDFLALLGKRFPSLPLFLYGHSFGGQLVLNYVLRGSPALDGVISTSPWLRLTQPPNVLAQYMVKLLACIFPGLTIRNIVDSSALSSRSSVASAYDKDPLVNNCGTMLFLDAALREGLWAIEHSSNFTLPLLLLHGTGDKITSHKASEEFARKVKGNVSFRLFKGLYHEMHNEPSQEELFIHIVRWLDAQVDTGPGKK